MFKIEVHWNLHKRFQEIFPHNIITFLVFFKRPNTINGDRNIFSIIHVFVIKAMFLILPF